MARPARRQAADTRAVPDAKIDERKPPAAAAGLDSSSQATDIPARDTVRIPRSSPRSCQTGYCKLLTRVDPKAETGFGFEGAPLRPGAQVQFSALWPTPEYPRIPIVLECAGPASGKAESGHRRHGQANLYILWRFDSVEKKWTELGRSHSDSWTWAIDLRPLAIRALEESHGGQFEVTEGFDDVISRIRARVDELRAEIAKLPAPERGRAIAILHDELAASYKLDL